MSKKAKQALTKARARLIADVTYLIFADRFVAEAGSVVVVDSKSGTGHGVAVRQTVPGRRPDEVHCFYTNGANLELLP